MSGPNKYREWILETIDSLRSRKARPDLERICRMVRRRHGSDPDRTRAELEKLIQEQTVLKVSYKGSISYRNAAKVQRKSRKTSEDPVNNNGDSALSFTDQEDDSEPNPSQHAAASKKRGAPPSPRSGNESIGGDGAAAARLVEQEKTSAATGAHEVRPGTGRDDALGGDMQPSPSGDDARNQTYAGCASIRKHTVAPQPKLPVEGGGTESNSDLGDRLVASVRSLSERSHGGTAAADGTGPVKPLGLKEILGCLSSREERLFEEKLTRGKVKVAMEREGVCGSLRRTRCGNITLPLRGTTTTEASAESLAKSALQPAIKDIEPIEEASDDEGVQEDSEDEEDPRSSNEERRQSLVTKTTAATLVGKTSDDSKKTSEEESFGHHLHHLRPDKVVDPLSRTESSHRLGAPPSLCFTAYVEGRPGTPDQPLMDVQSQIHTQHTQSGFNGVECKPEAGVSSCLLTPTASPRDTGLSEEQGMNDEQVNNGGFHKMEGARGSPADWTVSDVVTYFTIAGFPEQATAFGTQEIDGKSLLLMQRNDVLTGLSIRLGPALKIYERHVKVLQKTHFEDEDCT